MPWILLLFSILFFGLFSIMSSYVNFSQIILSSIFATFIILGSKGMNDFPGYIDLFKSFANNDVIYKSGSNFFENQVIYILSAEGGFEPGYIYLNRFFYFMGASPLVFFWLISFITNFLLLKFIYKFPRPVISLFFLVCTQLFFQQGNLIRQMLAIAILVHSIQYILKNELFKFLLIIFCAASFHVGSLLFLLIFIIYRLRVKRWVLLFIWISSIFIFYFPSIIPLGNILQTPLFAKDLTLDNNVGDLIHFNYLYNFILFLFLCTNFKERNSDHYTILVLIFCLGVSIGNIVSISEWFYRISLYFLLPIIILLSNIDKAFRSILKINLELGSIFMYIVLVVFLIFYPLRFSIYPDSCALGSKWYVPTELLDL